MCREEENKTNIQKSTEWQQHGWVAFVSCFLCICNVSTVNMYCSHNKGEMKYFFLRVNKLFLRKVSLHLPLSFPLLFPRIYIYYFLIDFL